MKILIDGDACSVTHKTERVAQKNNIAVHIFCDTKHIIDSDYADVHIVDFGHDSTDFAIVNHCEPNDIVITNDGGLAAMVLSRRAYAMNCKGKTYTSDNIMIALNKRHLRSSERKRTNRKQVHGLINNSSPCKCDFYESLQKLIDKLNVK